jgi:hypothetical protein
VLGLDALGHGLHPKAVRQADHPKNRS